MESPVSIGLLPMILASQDANTVFEAMREGFRGPTLGPIAVLFSISVALLFGLTFAVIYLRHRREARENIYSPTQLFHELATWHSFTREDRKLLRALAKAGQSHRPDRIFTQPTVLSAGRRSPRFQDAAMQRRIDQLELQLFGGETERDEVHAVRSAT